MSEPTNLDERVVEKDLRAILDPLDRQLARLTMLFPLALVTIVPIFFFILWLGVQEPGRRALVMSGGAFFVIIAIYLCWEILLSRLALARFDRRFPPTTPERALALRILTEMETPNKAEETLRAGLACYSPDRIVRHRRNAPDQPIETLPMNQGSDTQPLHLPADPNLGRRPGGYYDYIPLEPRPKDEG
jgi:hypothetical protein